MMNVKTRHVVFKTEDIGRLVGEEVGYANHGSSKLPNHLVKGYARINKPPSFELAYALGVFLTFPEYDKLRTDPSLIRVFGVPDINNPSVMDYGRAERQGFAVLHAIHNRALYFKKNSSHLLAGLAAAIMDYDIGNAPYGFIHTGHQVIDNCGMGGDMLKTFNCLLPDGQCV